METDQARTYGYSPRIDNSRIVILVTNAIENPRMEPCADMLLMHGYYIPYE